MANKFQIKRTAVSGREANTSVIDVGELALNITDGIMYSTNGSVVFEIGSNLTSQAVTGNANFDSGTLFVDSVNNRIGIGTTSPAYQVEIENTGSNALLVLDRTDGAACFIEGQAARSAFGSVGATPLALAYNSAAVVTIGAAGAITVNPDGASPYTFPTADGTNGQVLTTNGTGTLTFTTVAGGATNLSDSANSTTVTIASDTGTDAVLDGANATSAGVLTAVTQTIGGDKTFSNNITVSAGKTISGNGVNITSVNAAAVGGNTASTLLSRANHTDTQTLSTISDAGTMASQDATSVNIDGGAIDNTPIGASTANTGTFSTLVASGLTYPTSDGTNGQVLTTNGLGTLSFQDAGGVDLTAVASNIVPTANSTYDLGTTLKRWDELYVDDIIVTAGVTAASFTETSSIRYKENIRDLDSIIVDSLRPVVFDKKDGSSKDEAGFIAEEVLKLDPSLVLMNKNDEAEGIHYTRLIPHLVSYIQKLEQRVKELENG